MKQYIEGYANFLVETTRKQLGYNYDDNTHDDEVLAKLQAGEKLSKSKHIDGQPEITLESIVEKVRSRNKYNTNIYIDVRLDEFHWLVNKIKELDEN